jgi:hypothetical protein
MSEQTVWGELLIGLIGAFLLYVAYRGVKYRDISLDGCGMFLKIWNVIFFSFILAAVH